MNRADLRVAVGVSGGGRSLANLISVSKQPDCGYSIHGVIASNQDCAAVEIAAHAKLPIFIRSFKDPAMGAFKAELLNWLLENQIEMIALAGFIKRFPLLKDWEKRVINIHPALLPKFGGKGMYGHFVHEAVLEAGEKESGATLHYVNDHYDEGEIIARAHVEVLKSDNADSLAKSVFAAECDLFPKVLKGLADKSLPLPGMKVWDYDFK